MPMTTSPRAGVTKIPKTDRAAADLDKILRDLRVRIFARQMFAVLPDTRVVAEGFVRHIGTQLQFPGVPFLDLNPQYGSPLVETCICQAIEATSKALEAGERDRVRQFVVFVKHLFKNAPEIMGVEASYAGGGIWDPLGATSYPAWARGAQAVTFRIRDIEERVVDPRRPDVRTRLIARCVPPELLVRMQRLIPEIVAND